MILKHKTNAILVAIIFRGSKGNTIEPNIVITTHVEKKRKAQWQIIRNFQDTWAAKFPWVELVIGEDCKLHHV